MTNDQPLSLNWDVSNGYELERVNYPPDYPSDIYNISDTTVTLKLSDTFTLEEWNASNIYITRSAEEPALLESIILQSQPLTLEEIHLAALEIAEQLALPPDKIELWYQERLQAGDPGFDPIDFVVIRNDLFPSLVLKGSTSFNDANPWTLTLEIHWIANTLPQTSS